LQCPLNKTQFKIYKKITKEKYKFCKMSQTEQDFKNMKNTWSYKMRQWWNGIDTGRIDQVVFKNSKGQCERCEVHINDEHGFLLSVSKCKLTNNAPQVEFTGVPLEEGKVNGYAKVLHMREMERRRRNPAAGS